MDRPATPLPHVPKWAVIGALWLWFAVALLTHYGARSPYSYAGGVLGLHAERIAGLVVNYDAPSVRTVTQFFYDGTGVSFAKAHNLKLPLHSLLVAATAGFLRSYTLANYVVNVLALWLLAYVAVTLADQFAHPRAATLIAALTCAFLPIYTHYIGQPMHYVVGIAVNFLVMLAAMAGTRDPVRLGILTAVLTLSYDPYVFIAALIVTLRWRRIRDWAMYATVSLLPVLVWRTFLTAISPETVSPVIRDQFFKPVLAGWRRILTSPRDYALAPFVNGHLGLTMSFEMTLALIYWPVLILCAYGVWKTKPQTANRQLPTALIAFFVLEQLATAAYDWENNPRRALPILFAVSCAYFGVVAAKAHLRGWRIAFTVVMLVSLFLTLSDTLGGNPVVGYLPTGEAMKHPTKQVLQVGQSHLDPIMYPTLKADQPPQWWDVPRAHVTRPLVFLFANLFVAAMTVALLSVLRARALLPRYVPAAVAVVLLLSLGARFL
jgi:hypothetical protein